jgi:hypothetical protein
MTDADAAVMTAFVRRANPGNFSRKITRSMVSI